MKVVLTPEIHARIVQYVRAGIPPRTAAGAAGVPPKVFGGWMVRGRQTSRGRYRALWDAIVQSEAQFEVELGAEVYRAAPTHDRVGFGFLERRYAETYGRRRLGLEDPHAPASAGIHLPPRRPLPMADPTPPETSSTPPSDAPATPPSP